jgi:hypothetical protein
VKDLFSVFFFSSSLGFLRLAGNNGNNNKRKSRRDLLRSALFFEARLPA